MRSCRAAGATRDRRRRARARPRRRRRIRRIRRIRACSLVLPVVDVVDEDGECGPTALPCRSASSVTISALSKKGWRPQPSSRRSCERMRRNPVPIACVDRPGEALKAPPVPPRRRRPDRDPGARLTTRTAEVGAGVLLTEELRIRPGPGGGHAATRSSITRRHTFAILDAAQRFCTGISLRNSSIG